MRNKYELDKYMCEIGNYDLIRVIETKLKHSEVKFEQDRHLTYIT